MNYNHLRENAVFAAQRDQFALTALTGLFPGYLPWSSAALRPSAIQILVNDIILNRRVRVVEFGTGISTVYLAIAVARNGGHMLSFDHDRAWQESASQWLPSETRGIVELVCAPLAADRPGDSAGEAWYDLAVVRAALDPFGPIDLALFDGPPAHDESRRFARRPGFTAIRSYLAESATIALDDINRTGEQIIAREWSAELKRDHVDAMARAGIALWSIGPTRNVL